MKMNITIETENGDVLQVDFYSSGGEHLVTDWLAARNLANVIIGMTQERYKAFKAEEDV